MKAWLLALVVVAFVCTDPGIPFAKGCAQKCNYLEPYNTICCCTKDNCNI
uniref:3FTx-Cyl-2 n=1 Tax=Cylindrophis ruffus TaxID=186578 RepID=M9SZV9_CYLRU